MPSGKKHPKDHYVPKFYLKRWSQNNPNQKLYSVRYFQDKDEIKWTLRSPSGTGYERDLYGDIEQKFFKPLDDKASKVVNRLESQSIYSPVKIDLGEKDHENWAIFILGFIIRMPDKVQFIQNSFAKAGVDIETTRKQIPEIIKNNRAVKDIRSLTWLFARIESNLELITCDNPLIFKPSNLSHPDCVLILPMGPKHFFLAASKETIGRLEQNPRKMVSNINNEIIMNAIKRIYARTKHSIKDNFIIKNWKHKIT